MEFKLQRTPLRIVEEEAIKTAKLVFMERKLEKAVAVIQLTSEKQIDDCWKTIGKSSSIVFDN
jgi:hypothetical protein